MKKNFLSPAPYNYRFEFCVLLLVIFSMGTKAQTAQIGPNQYAFQFTLNPAFGLFFNAATQRVEFLNGAAQPVLGFDANNGRFHTSLEFSQGSDFMVPNNRYAFRAKSNPQIGLYFNAEELRYEFRNSNASPTAYIRVDEPRLWVSGGVTLGNTAHSEAGTLRWTGTAFEGYDGNEWISLAQIIEPGALTNLQAGYLGGRIINASQGAVSIEGTDGLIVSGIHGSGDEIELQGDGSRMFFNPRRSAFRAGLAENSSWDADSLGNYSFAAGRGNLASGESSAALGTGNSATGIGSFTAGITNQATGNASVSLGLNSHASGEFSFAAGLQNNASGFGSIAMGSASTATGTNAIALGSSAQATGSFSTGLGFASAASGGNSTAIGFQSSASGGFASAFGWNSSASGAESTAVGANNTASGAQSTALGYSNSAVADQSMALGFSSEAEGIGSTAIGMNTTALSANEIALGTYNTMYIPEGGNVEWQPNDRLLVLGNGKSNSSRSNALVVLKNGNAGLGTSTPTAKLQVENGNLLVRGDAMTPPIALTGAGPAMFYAPQKAAFRTGSIQGPNWDADSLGQNSFASGVGTKARGVSSFAMGEFTEATGSMSIAAGLGSVAKGTMSMAIGDEVRAFSYAETVFGALNTMYTPAGGTDTWALTDRLFVIGNGDQDTLRDAMVVLKNGNVGIGNSSPSARLHVGDGTGATMMIGSNETIEDAGPNLLRIMASIQPKTDNGHALGTPGRRWNTVFAVNGTINTSDAREKSNITELQYGLDEINALKPVSYQWKEGPDQSKKLGLIAQDLQAIIPEVVVDRVYTIDDEETGAGSWKQAERLGVYYSDIIPLLIKGIQELDTKIDDPVNEQLLQRIADLEQQNTVLHEAVKTLTKQFQRMEDDLEYCCFDAAKENRSAIAPDVKVKAELGQNIPNPFKESTSIHYFLPEEVVAAFITVVDLHGRAVLEQDLGPQRGVGHLEINTSQLQAGTYLYSLFVDGTLINSKKMVLMR